MNSRQRRKQAADLHNARADLMREFRQVRARFCAVTGQRPPMLWGRPVTDTMIRDVMAAMQRAIDAAGGAQ